MRVQRIQKGAEGSKGCGRRLYGHALGVRVQRVQKVQKVQRVVVGGYAASLYKTFIIALAGEGKPYNRAYGARKCTSSAYGTSPGGGGFSGTML